MMQGARRALAVAVGTTVTSLLAACAGDAPRSRTPLFDVSNREADPRLRVAAVPQARAEAEGNVERLGATQRVFRDVLWSAKEPAELRLAVLRSMLEDADPKVREEGRTTAKLLLPRENSRQVVVYLSQQAGQNGWTDFTPSLIRSYSRELPKVEEEERAERVALLALHPGKTVEQVAFEGFLNPPELEPTYGLDWAQRFRADAWDLLGRLDRDGSLRLDFLTSAPAAAGEDETVATIRACVRELGALPRTGDELKWLMSLRDPKKKANAAWWTEAAAAVQQVRDRGPFQIRHAEPIRWATANRPEWVRLTREDLLSAVRARLAGRKHHVRSTEGGSARVREVLDQVHERLRWGDLLTILVLDEQLSQPWVVQALHAQSQMDRRDETTEYGGVLAWQPDGQPAAALFPPRPGQREGDHKFVASEDMINASDRALAHYHFHAQEKNNVEYAGPSGGDLTYAFRLGRNCLVVTTVGEEALSVDYYQPDGVVVDLGVLAGGLGKR